MVFESKPIPPHLHFEMLVLENPRNLLSKEKRNGSFLPDDIDGFAVNPRHLLNGMSKQKKREYNAF